MNPRKTDRARRCYSLIVVVFLLIWLVGGAVPTAHAQDVELRVVGRWPEFPGELTGVAVSGDYAYLSARNGVLHVMDISNPAEPERVGGFAGLGREDSVAGFGETGVAVSGHYAYVVSSGSESGEWIAGFHVIDVANPASPQEVGEYDTANWRADSVVVAGDYAYLVAGDLHIVDITNPARPRKVSQYVLDQPGNTVVAFAISEDYAYAETGEAGLQVINISDPANPRRVGACQTTLNGFWPRRLAVAGDYVYVAGTSRDEQSNEDRGTLEVIDVGDPDAPHPVGRYDTALVGRMVSVSVAGEHAYVVGHLEERPFVEDDGYGYVAYRGLLTVLDVSNPSNPGLVEEVPLGDLWNAGWHIGQDLAVSGQHAYVVNNAHDFQVFDVSNPASLEEAGRHDFDGSGLTADFWVQVSGDLAYLNWVVDLGVEGSVVLDISNPASPKKVWDFYRADQAPWGYAVPCGDYALFLRDHPRGLQMFDMSDPRNPQQVWDYDAEGIGASLGWGLSATGNYAYLGGECGDDDCLHVIDISNPREPHRIGTYRSNYDWWWNPGPSGFLLQGEFHYERNAAGDWLISDISDPANPKPIGTYAGIAAHFRVTISGDFAYLVSHGGFNQTSWIRVIDIFSPAAPKVIAVYENWETRWPYGLPVSADFDHRRGENGEWEVYDVRDFNVPKRVGFLSAFASAVGVQTLGHYAIIGDELVDISDPANLQQADGSTAYHRSIGTVHADNFFAAGYGELNILKMFTILRFGWPNIEADGNIWLPVDGASGQRVKLQRSTNLVDWEDWRTMTLGGTGCGLTDTTTTAAHRFYRVVEDELKPSNQQ